jgi:hypothetical protein
VLAAANLGWRIRSCKEPCSNLGSKTSIPMSTRQPTSYLGWRFWPDGVRSISGQAIR